MDAKGVVPRQPRGGKMKDEREQGKNRQVLRDIGNLTTLHVVEWKISRPMTRSFCSQLLANGQEIAENNKLLTVDEGVASIRKGRIVKKAALPQKVYQHAKDENVIVISSDDEENVKEVKAQKKVTEKPKPEKMILISHIEGEKVKPVGGQSSREQSSRRNVETVTSILTARSKIACGIANKQKDLIVNIDAEDVNDELAVVEYVDDMYTFYKHTENDSRVHDYMVSQPNINAKMRSILVDWLIEVHNRFELMPETLYLTINIMDRYLSLKKSVTRKELQLVGIGSMLIACKYEEIWAPRVNDFICISDYAYVGHEICVMEKAILGELGWYLTVPTPYVFLVRYSKASTWPDPEMENLVFFLAELGISHYSTIISYSPSMLAAASVFAARCTLNKTPFWTETLKHHTGYCEEQLKDCVKLLVSFHLAAVESQRKLGVYQKFLSPNRGTVALIAPARRLLD